LAVGLAALAAAAPARGQAPPAAAPAAIRPAPAPVEYRSAGGVAFRAGPDTGAVARADSAVTAEPRRVDRLLALGLAQAGVRQYRAAIATFTRALAVAPDSLPRERATLYRWRGHRYLSVGEFGRALDDLTRGSRLDSANYGIWYHLGIARYARGDFAGSAVAFARAQPLAPDAGELAGATDWRWMALARAGRTADARAMLARRPDSLAAANAYAQRLRLYRGELAPDAVLTPADTAAVAVATLSYGVGNWYLVRGDTARARAWFERSVRSGGWPAFGFLMSEVELRRLRRPAGPRPARAAG
jgi:tetratricopeptide (TPR) repeat protein